MLWIYCKTCKDKAGAAHSPLVCFPGQGWEIVSVRDSVLEAGGDRVNASTGLLRKGAEAQYILYWFQAGGRRTSPGTFMQKLNLFGSALLEGEEANAFVRVTAVAPGGDAQAAEANARRFLESFYPSFKAYLGGAARGDL